MALGNEAAAGVDDILAAVRGVARFDQLAALAYKRIRKGGEKEKKMISMMAQPKEDEETNPKEEEEEEEEEEEMKMRKR